jgi:hypothetical protein
LISTLIAAPVLGPVRLRGGCQGIAGSDRGAALRCDRPANKPPDPTLGVPHDDDVAAPLSSSRVVKEYVMSRTLGARVDRNARFAFCNAATSTSMLAGQGLAGPGMMR